MLATHSLKKTALFSPCKQYLVKCLFKFISQPYVTFTKSAATPSLLCKQSSVSSTRNIVNKLVNICSWCGKKNTIGLHRQFSLQTYSNSCSGLFIRGSYTSHRPSKFAWNASEHNVRSLHIKKSLFAASTRTNVPPKVPLAKSAPFRRIGRKKPGSTIDDSIHHQNVVSYAVGEEMNLRLLRDEIIADDVYSVVDLPSDIADVLMITAKYKVNGQAREAFFFRDGGVAFWHMSESERHDLWHLARSFTVNPYPHQLIVEESEALPVVYDTATKLRGDVVHLKTQEEGVSFDEECTLHKYTFSNALSQSVSLSVNEANLEKFIDQLEPETQKLRHGMNSSLKKKDINMKLGEVFQLRHTINLESGYLDHPDIYWERDELEGLYRQMIMYLVMPKRIQVLNERLNYCSEILQLLNSQLNDQQHVRLELIIIVLILIEVVFECVHYAEKYGLTIGRTGKTKD